MIADCCAKSRRTWSVRCSHEGLYRHLELLCGAGQATKIIAEQRGLGLRLVSQFEARFMQWYSQARFDILIVKGGEGDVAGPVWERFDARNACCLGAWFDRRLHRRRCDGEVVYNKPGWADLQQFVLYDGECVDTIQNERQHTAFLHMLTGPCGRVGQQSVKNVISQSFFNYIQRDHARQFGKRVVKSSRGRTLRVKRAVQKTKVSKALFRNKTEGEHGALDGGSYDRGVAVC